MIGRKKHVKTASGELAMAPPLAWELLRENIPAAPPQAVVMPAVALRTDELIKLQHTGGRRMLRLAYALALAIILALCGGTVFWFGGRDQHTAWASAEGYVLHYEIFDREVVHREWKTKLPNDQAFTQAVQDWARQNKIQLSEHGWIDAPRFVGLCPGNHAGNLPETIKSNGYKIQLIGISAAERDELIKRLASLPGVAPPAVGEYAQYYALPGLAEPLAPSKVIINRKAYDFPQDFTLEEANALQWLFMFNRDKTGYYAFKTILGRVKPKANKFDLGDVFIAELDDRSDMVLTTLKRVWKEGRKLKNDPLFLEQHGGISSGAGWSVTMSRTLPEPGFDPLAALAARDEQQADTETESGYGINTSFTYQFFSPERMLAPGAPKYSADEAARAKALVGQLDTSLDAFQTAHPEYWDKRLHYYRIIRNRSSFGDMPLRYFISVPDRDGKVAEQVQELLAKIPGLPEVQIVRRDVQAEVKALLREDPSIIDGSKPIPPLPQPDPAQWHACQGYKLVYRMLDRMYEGESFGYETEATRAFTSAAKQWAAEHGVAVNPQPAPAPVAAPGSAPSQRPQLPDIALYMAGPGWSGQFESFTEAVFTLYIAAPDPALPGSLAAALTALPGVAPPKTEVCRFYVHDSRPDYPLTGGDLVVDSKRYRFPYDFAWEEASSFNLRGDVWHGVHYTAFFTLAGRQRDRIKFPDIARLETMADGSTALTTFMQDWPEGRKLLAAWSGTGGPTVELPADVAESSFDPLPALSRQLRAGERKTAGSTRYILTYYISAKDHWLQDYVAGQNSAGVKRRGTIYAELDRRLTKWLAAHPEYQGSDTARSQVYWNDYPFTGLALGAEVIIYSDDDKLAKELTRILARIRGLPEPVATQEPVSRGSVTFRVTKP